LCPAGWKYNEEEFDCTLIICPFGAKVIDGRCDCGAGMEIDPKADKCVDISCADGEYYNADLGRCAFNPGPPIPDCVSINAVYNNGTC
jgi:hypothetical protein